MVKDAEAHAEEDTKRKGEVETRNRADQSVHAASTFLKESGEKVPAEDRMAIESAVNDVKQALEANEAEAITRTLDALMQAQAKAAQELYKQAAPEGGAPGAEAAADGQAAESASADGDVIDAEVIEDEKVEEKK